MTPIRLFTSSSTISTIVTETKKSQKVLHRSATFGLLPSIQELRVYDDKGAQQLEYAMMMPPALYSTKKEDAENYLKSTSYPFVSKAIEGAHASNVRLVNNEKQAREEIEAIFSTKGRSRHDKHQAGLTQQGYVLWQKFMPDNPNDCV